MSELDSYIKWKAAGVNGHSEKLGGDFLYTSNDAPVEADAYERQRQRAEAADQQLMVYRVLLTQAMMVSATESARLDDLGDFANEYFESIFDTALQSGAFVEAQCGSVGILQVAKQLNVVLEEE